MRTIERQSLCGLILATVVICGCRPAEETPSGALHTQQVEQPGREHLQDAKPPSQDSKEKEAVRSSRRPENRPLPEIGAPPPRPLGTVSVNVKSIDMVEGDNPDFVLTIQNQVPNTFPLLAPPSTEFSVLGYHVKEIGGNRLEYRSRPVEEIVEMGIRYRGVRFELESNKKISFPILLLGEEFGIDWLPPGTYDVVLSYLSLPGALMS